MAVDKEFPSNKNNMVKPPRKKKAKSVLVEIPEKEGDVDLAE